MKTILTTLSLVNGLMGVFLIGMFLVSDSPLIALGLGMGLLIQAGYTLVYMAGGLAGVEPWSRRAFLAGQTVAVLVGGIGFVAAALSNINPLNGDSEYGPFVVATLIAAHAATSLWAYAVADRSRTAAA